MADNLLNRTKTIAADGAHKLILSGGTASSDGTKFALTSLAPNADVGKALVSKGSSAAPAYDNVASGYVAYTGDVFSGLDLETTVEGALNTVGAKIRKIIYVGNAAPTTDHDGVDSAGLGITFVVGSFWLNSTTGTLYQATDVTTNAAVWANRTPAAATGYNQSIVYGGTDITGTYTNATFFPAACTDTAPAIYVAGVGPLHTAAYTITGQQLEINMAEVGFTLSAGDRITVLYRQ